MPPSEPAFDSPLDQLLNSVIAEFEAKTDAFAECEVYDKMQFALGNLNLTEREQDLFAGESAAFLFRRRHQDDPPGYFQPIAILPNAGGVMTPVPDPNRLTGE
jgi:hypothetical protein